jgi:hypothetical protein
LVLHLNRASDHCVETTRLANAQRTYSTCSLRGRDEIYGIGKI